MREINHAGIGLIRDFEGCRLEAYPDPGTGGDPWTIGWGSTGPDIEEGTVWTQEEADARFASDINDFAAGVAKGIKVDVSDNQFAAMVSLAYNIGLGKKTVGDKKGSGFLGSTLLKRVNEERFDEAADEFLKWNKAAGRVMPGLTRRREAERELFLTPDA